MKLKKIQEGTHAHELMRYASATLGSGNIKQAVALPEGEDLNEWVAVNSESLRVCKVCVCTYVRTYVSVMLACDICSLFSPLLASRGLLQPDQHALWDHHRVLHTGVLSSHVCWTKVSEILPLQLEGVSINLYNQEQVDFTSRLSFNFKQGTGPHALRFFVFILHAYVALCF